MPDRRRDPRLLILLARRVKPLIAAFRALGAGGLTFVWGFLSILVVAITNPGAFS